MDVKLVKDAEKGSPSVFICRVARQTRKEETFLEADYA
jgi:hypothetical protein